VTGTAVVAGSNSGATFAISNTSAAIFPEVAVFIPGIAI
jgi:hypothetical protein